MGGPLVVLQNDPRTAISKTCIVRMAFVQGRLPDGRIYAVEKADLGKKG